MKASTVKLGISMLGLLGLALAQPGAVSAAPRSFTHNEKGTTPTEELTDQDWQNMSSAERRARWRKSTMSRYLDGAEKADISRIQHYIDKFSAATVYDDRYYLFKVKATPVSGSQSDVDLAGEVYPAEYASGVTDLLETLGFHVAKNDLVTLPKLESDQKPYGVSTTTAATLRREPRRNAEQVNSVAQGGLIRVLRTARDSDITSRKTSFGHHAPGASKLPQDSASDWLLVQTMEGYLGFARRADFKMTEKYTLPDGFVKHPTHLADSQTTVPAGIYLYGNPEAGWTLSDGQKLAADAEVVDLRPKFSADEILEEFQPFLGTPYVWGGVTNQGIDCSGFSQFFMRSAGALIPRDATQQATGGLIVAWGHDVLQKAKPGDLVFFTSGNGRVSHVAISLGGSRIIHSQGPGVHVSDLTDKHERDSDRQWIDSVIFARRLALR